MSWAPVGIALIICHFFIPFALLLSRDIKRKPARLSLVAVWVLLVNLLDMFWLVMPTLDPNSVKFALDHPRLAGHGRPGRGLRRSGRSAATTRSRSRIPSWTSPSATGSPHEPAHSHAHSLPPEAHRMRTGTTAST